MLGIVVEKLIADAIAPAGRRDSRGGLLNFHHASSRTSSSVRFFFGHRVVTLNNKIVSKAITITEAISRFIPR